jgi:hypothetical protein
MRVLLDENLPHDLRHLIIGHDVATVTYQGWSGLKNGVLLRAAAAAGFDVLLTMDGGIMFQQNVQALPLSVLIISADSNDIDDLRPKVAQIMATLETLGRCVAAKV